MSVGSWTRVTTRPLTCPRLALPPGRFCITISINQESVLQTVVRMHESTGRRCIISSRNQMLCDMLCVWAVNSLVGHGSSRAPSNFFERLGVLRPLRVLWILQRLAIVVELPLWKALISTDVLSPCSNGGPWLPGEMGCWKLVVVWSLWRIRSCVTYLWHSFFRSSWQSSQQMLSDLIPWQIPTYSI